MHGEWVHKEAEAGYDELRPQDHRWEDPDELARTAAVIKHSPTRAVIRVDAATDGGPALYIKRYRFEDLRRRVKTALGYSRAMDERRACLALRARAIGAPRPMFAGDRRIGALRYESYLVTEAIDGGVAADAILDGCSAEERVAVLRALGRIVGRLHDRGVFHDDLKPAHILLAGGTLPGDSLTGVSLIDLYRCRVGREPSMRRRGVNLAQLYMGIAHPHDEHRRALVDGFTDVVNLTAAERSRLESAVDRAITIRCKRRRRSAARGSLR